MKFFRNLQNFTTWMNWLSIAVIIHILFFIFIPLLFPSENKKSPELQIETLNLSFAEEEAPVSTDAIPKPASDEEKEKPVNEQEEPEKEPEPEPVPEIKPEPIPEKTPIPEPIIAPPKVEKKIERKSEPEKPVKPLNQSTSPKSETNNASSRELTAKGSSINVNSPVLLDELERLMKVYPPEARKKRIQGIVTVHLKISDVGRVIDVEIAKSSGYSVLDRDAVKMIKRAKFKPALHNGKPVPGEMPLDIKYQLLKK